MKAVALFLAVAALVPCFLLFDWDHGLVRGGLLLGLLALVAVAWRLGPALAWPASPRFERAVWALVAVLGAVHLGVAISSAWRAGVLGKETEMGAINYRALKVVLAGQSPWAPTSLLDRGAFHALVTSPDGVRCLEPSGEDAVARFESWWQSADVALMDAAVPRVREGVSDCAGPARELRFLSYKYGPVTLASYAPFVAVLGRAGVQVSHLAWLALLCVVLARQVRRWALTARVVQWVPVLTLLLSGVVAVDFLQHTDCDLIAVLLAVLAWSALESERPGLGALALAASISAKLLPGALLVPVAVLTLWRTPRALVLFGAGVLALLGVAWWSSPQGAVDSLWTFNVARPGDSTAFSSVLPAAVASWLPLAGALTVGAGAVMAHRVGTREARLLAALVGILVFLLTAKVFHNNYVAWFLPFLGWWLALSTAPRATSAQAL